MEDWQPWRLLETPEEEQEWGWGVTLEPPAPIRDGLNRFTAANRASAQRRRLALGGLAAALALAGGLLLLGGQLSLAVLSLVVALVCLGGSHWLWCRSRFCNRCGIRTKSAFSGPERFWCPACSQLTTSARAALGPVGQFVVTDFLASPDGVVKAACLLLLTAVRDQARVVRIECEHEALHIRTSFGQQIYEMSPPPVWLYSGIVRFFQAITGMEPELIGPRQEGHVDLFICAERVPCTVLIESTATGGSLELHLPDTQCQAEDSDRVAEAE